MSERDRIREKIVTLYEHSSYSQAEIAEVVGVNQSTVSRVIKLYQETGDTTTSYSNCGGHNKKYDERDLRCIRRIAISSPRSTAMEIKKQLGPRGDQMSRSTIYRALDEANIVARKPYQRPFLSTSHMERRLSWCQDHRNWTVDMWKRVVFSDETMIYVNDHSSKFVRVVDGCPLTPAHYNVTTKFPRKVMMWACFSFEGPGRAHLVEETLNSDKYIAEIVQRRVIPQMRDWYPRGDGIFQQDNAPSHSSRKTLNCLKDAGISMLDWPSQSPDLNPIENLWSVVKQRLRKMNCGTKQEVIAGFLKVWNHDDDIVTICQNLVLSMPRRVEAVIKAKGGHSKY